MLMSRSAGYVLPAIMAGFPVITACRATVPDRSAAVSESAALVVRAFSAEDTTAALPMLEVWAWSAGRSPQGQASAHVRQDDDRAVVLRPLRVGEYQLRIASIAYATQWAQVEVAAHCTDTLTVFIPRNTHDLVERRGQPGRWRLSGCASGT